MTIRMTRPGRSGILDWLIQRVTAVIVAAFIVAMLVWLLVTGDVTYAAWKGLFATAWMQSFTLLALLATCVHAWIGMWTVGTDYIQTGNLGKYAETLLFLYQLGCALVLIIYLLWGINILWGTDL